MSRKLRALLALILLVAATGTSLVVFQAESGTKAAQRWSSLFTGSLNQNAAKAALQTCNPSSFNGDYLLAQDCWDQLIYESVLSGKWREFAATVAPFVAEDRASHDVCHNGSHQAGQRLFKLWKDGPARFDDTIGTFCSSGLAHGYLIAFGESQASADDWKKMATICENAPVDRRGPCADGYGHATMESDREHWRDTMSRCENFVTEEKQVECAGGVIMDLYVGHPFPTPEALTEVCVGWDKPTFASGCSLGLGVIAGRGPAEVTNLSRSDLWATMTSTDLQKIVDASGPWVRVCTTSPDPQECLGQFFYAMPQRFVNDGEVNAMLCSSIRESEFNAMCRQAYRPEFRVK